MKKNLSFSRFAVLTLILLLAGAVSAQGPASGGGKNAIEKTTEISSSRKPFAATRVGFVNIEKVFREAKLIRDLREEINKQADEKRESIESKQDERARLREELERKRPVLSDAEITSIGKETRRLRNEIVEEQYALNKLLATEGKQLGPAMEKLIETVKEVARKECYDIVLDGVMVFYGDPSVDISDKVVERLNSEYKKPEKDKNTGKEKKAPAISKE